REFGDELDRWRDAGRVADFWWRDDDAAHPTAALARLTSLSGRCGVPLALAVIPADAQESIFADLPQTVEVLQHGGDHRNRAPEGSRSCEFPSGARVDAALARLADGRSRLQQLARARLLPVLVPPWNRFAPELVAMLPGLGICGISTVSARSAAEPVPGVRQVNVHVDLIAWRGGRGFVGEAAALALAVKHLSERRAHRADPGEPTGWLTHHALHDEPLWSFLERLFQFTATHSAARWLRAVDVFGVVAGA
ncbi:MAG: polysaccharide deacetylase family protein, partial [Pseudomonadota bacterium]